MALPSPPLRDEAAGIRLRPWAETAADAAALAAAWADPAVAATSAVPADRTPAAAAAWIADAPARRRTGLALDLVIAPAAPAGSTPPAGEQEQGRVLGEVGLVHLDPEGRAEIGFWLAPDARGRGVATAAVRLLTDWALDGDGLGRRLVWARTTPGDGHAAGVLRRAGYDERGEAGGSCLWRRVAASLRG